MKTQSRKESLLASSLIPLVLAVSLFTACRPDPVAWTLEITAATQDSVRLDFVAINQLQKAEWDALSVDRYWDPQNSARGSSSSGRLTFDLEDGKLSLLDPGGVDLTGIGGTNTGLVTIPREHPIWTRWFENNVVGLVVIGRFPGSGSDRTDGADLRKRVIPLFKQCWDTKHRTLRVEIRDNQIAIATPPSRKAPKDCF